MFIQKEMARFVPFVGSIIKALKTVENPDVKDCWGVSVVFECEGCHLEYSITNYDKEETAIFLQALSSKTYHHNDLYCTACNGIDVYKKAYSKAISKAAKEGIKADALATLPNYDFNAFIDWCSDAAYAVKQ